MLFDRKKFFFTYHKQVGDTSQVEVDNLTQIFNYAEVDKRITSIRVLAYMIATARWETRRFERLREVGSRAYLSQYDGKGGNRAGTNDYYDFRGGGWCHITFRDNYRKATKWCKDAKLDVDLESQPVRIIESAINYEVMVSGHLLGGFTGFKLTDYVSDTLTDYRNARLVINPGELYIADGRWKAKTVQRKQQCVEAVQTIVEWAKGCEAALRVAELPTTESQPVPVGSDASEETFEPKTPDGGVTPQFIETAKAQGLDLAKTSITGLSFSSVLSWFGANRWLTLLIFLIVFSVVGIIFRKSLKLLIQKAFNLVIKGA